MRVTMATKFSAVILGLVGLAFASTLAALISAWHARNQMQQALRNNVPSVRAADELEIWLVEQRASVASYLLDNGNRLWLEELSQQKAEFDRWWRQARATAHTQDEEKILNQLHGVYRKYDTRRDEVIAIFDAGDKEWATRLLLGELTDLHDEAYRLCEGFIGTNERYVEWAMARAEQRTWRATVLVAVMLALTFGLGAGLLWLLFQRMVIPLRRLMADATVYTSHAAEPAAGADDELRLIALYLQSLMSDVADTRAALKTTRGRLRNAEKLASVGKLAASVAHEMRNPLTAIKMWLYSIEGALAGEESVRATLQSISEEITRLENIVRNFLEFSRPPALKLRPHSVSGLIDKTLELVGPRLAEQGVRVVREEAAGLPRVLADADQLKQVLLNVMDNAAEAMGQGGTIRVSTAAEAEADGRPMVVLRVSDSGPGMPEEVRRRIFEPFFTTKEDGTGLGLCIAARIISRHRGRIVLEPASGQGTTFAIYIPAVQEDEHG